MELRRLHLIIGNIRWYIKCDAEDTEVAVKSHNRRTTIVLWEFYDQNGKFLVADCVALLSLVARNSVTSRQFRCHRWCNRWAAAQFARRISSRVRARRYRCTYGYVHAWVRECVYVAASGKDWCHGPTNRWSWPGSHCRYIDGFERFYVRTSVFH